MKTLGEEVPAAGSAVREGLIKKWSEDDIMDLMLKSGFVTSPTQGTGYRWTQTGIEYLQEEEGRLEAFGNPPGPGSALDVKFNEQVPNLIVLGFVATMEL